MNPGELMLTTKDEPPAAQKLKLDVASAVSGLVAGVDNDGPVKIEEDKGVQTTPGDGSVVPLHTDMLANGNARTELLGPMLCAKF